MWVSTLSLHSRIWGCFSHMMKGTISFWAEEWHDLTYALKAWLWLLWIQSQMSHRIFPDKKEANYDFLVDPLILCWLGNFIFSKWNEWREDKKNDFWDLLSKSLLFKVWETKIPQSSPRLIYFKNSSDNGGETNNIHPSVNNWVYFKIKHP